MRHTIRFAVLAFLLSISWPALAYYMTPATAVASFAVPGNSVLSWSFPIEVLHREFGPGGRHIHFEIQTRPYTHTDGTTYGPGTFTRGTASGLFVIDMGSGLTPNSPQFWWPGGVNGGATNVQPPDKLGQDLGGRCKNTEGIDPVALSNGYTAVVPVPTQDQNGFYVFLTLTGPGKTTKSVLASDFIASGYVKIHCDVFYMEGE